MLNKIIGQNLINEFGNEIIMKELSEMKKNILKLKNILKIIRKYGIGIETI